MSREAGEGGLSPVRDQPREQLEALAGAAWGCLHAWNGPAPEHLQL